MPSLTRHAYAAAALEQWIDRKTLWFCCRLLLSALLLAAAAALLLAAAPLLPAVAHPPPKLKMLEARSHNCYPGPLP